MNGSRARPSALNYSKAILGKKESDDTLLVERITIWRLTVLLNFAQLSASVLEPNLSLKEKNVKNKVILTNAH